MGTVAKAKWEYRQRVGAVASRLHATRTDLGISRVGVARALKRLGYEFSPATIQKFEEGRVDQPSDQFTQGVERFLEIVDAERENNFDGHLTIAFLVSESENFEYAPADY